MEGLAGITAAVVTLVWSGITALALLYVIAAWALLTGAFEIAVAVRLRQIITGEWLLVLCGIESIGSGILLMVFPGPGALVMVLWIGAYAFVFGVLLIALSLRLRSWGRSRSPYAARAA